MKQFSISLLTVCFMLPSSFIYAQEKLEIPQEMEETVSDEVTSIYLVELVDQSGKLIESITLTDTPSKKFAADSYAQMIPAGWHFQEEIKDLGASSFFRDLDRSDNTKEYFVRRIEIAPNPENLDLEFDVTKPIYLSFAPQANIYFDSWSSVGMNSYDGEEYIKEILLRTINAELLKMPYHGKYYQALESVKQDELVPVYSDIGVKTILFYKNATDLKVTNRKTMMRLYNHTSGEHFYTANLAEHDALVDLGWKDEGTAWIAPIKSDIPVYRLYNPNSGDHHYTKNKEEYDTLVNQGWKGEDIGWYSATESELPLFRLYNPKATSGNHHYTLSEFERSELIARGWKDEDIGWYGLQE